MRSLSRAGWRSGAVLVRQARGAAGGGISSSRGGGFKYSCARSHFRAGRSFLCQGVYTVNFLLQCFSSRLSTSLHSSSPGTQVAAVAIKEPRLLLSNSPAPLFFTTIPPGAEVSRAEDFSLFPSLLFYYRESAVYIRERTPCSWSRSWSLTVQPVTGSAHTITAMEYLKFCFVFSCWLKFANSVSSTETPQAPAPIPKGEQKKQNKTKNFLPLFPKSNKYAKLHHILWLWSNFFFFFF